MPTPLFVSAATMPARAVPWPFASVDQTLPSTNDAPAATTPSRSGWVVATPVSRIATTAEPAGSTTPYAWSHAIFGRDHWSPYWVSSGMPSAARVRSRSTAATRASAARAAATASEADTACSRNAGIESRLVTPAAASAASWSDADASLRNVTSQELGSGEGVGEGDGSGTGVGSGVGSGSRSGRRGGLRRRRRVGRRRGRRIARRGGRGDEPGPEHGAHEQGDLKDGKGAQPAGATRERTT